MLGEKVVKERYSVALLDYSKYKTDEMTELLAYLYRAKILTYAEVLGISNSQAEIDMQDALTEKRMAAS